MSAPVFPDASLDGVLLSQVHPCLRVTDIGAVDADVPAIEIDFALLSPDPLVRREAMTRVRTWAQGRRLTLSDQPGRFLLVRLTAPPLLDSVLCWTAPLHLTLAADGPRCWQADAQTTASRDAQFSAQTSDWRAELSLTLEGNAATTPVDVTLRSTGDAPMRLVSLRAGSTMILLSGLAVPPGGEVWLRHDAERDTPAFFAVSGEKPESLLACRSAASSDDLLLPCGAAGQVIAISDQPFSCAAHAAARWL